MSNVFVRHAPQCPHRENSYHKRCRCRKWIYLDGGERISAETRSWEEAESRLRELEAGATKSEAMQEDTRKTISEAIDFYLQKAKDEGNTTDTLNKKTRIFRGLIGRGTSPSHSPKVLMGLPHENANKE